MVPVEVGPGAGKVVPGALRVHQAAAGGLLHPRGGGGGGRRLDLARLGGKEACKEAHRPLNQAGEPPLLLLPGGDGRGGGLVRRGEAPELPPKLAKHGDDIGKAACVPVGIGGEPTAHVLSLVYGDKLEHFGANLEEGRVAVEPVLLPGAAELGEEGLDRGRHPLLLAGLRLHVERPDLRRGHELQRAFEHEAVGDVRDAAPQPVDLVEVKDERGKEGVRPVERRGEGLGVRVDVRIGEDEDLQPRALLHGLCCRLLVQLPVEGLEPGHQDDAKAFGSAGGVGGKVAEHALTLRHLLALLGGGGGGVGERHPQLRPPFQPVGGEGRGDALPHPPGGSQATLAESHHSRRRRWNKGRSIPGPYRREHCPR
mmetsp:Transcript_2938/g.7503  ORF Transcript_2938/g.7503 Transcript_2938/m.7503 type:complete len:369 (-) Transcript_2938:85-1191(-)